MKLNIKHFFDSAHQLTDSKDLVTKACARLHGHTYAVIVECESGLNNAGMVIDFKAVKNVIDTLDHRYINDVFKEKGISLQPTAENIAIVLASWIEALGVRVTRISVCEGYKGNERASWAVYEP